MQKFDLELEKYWVTRSGFFRLATTVALMGNLFSWNFTFKCGQEIYNKRVQQEGL